MLFLCIIFVSFHIYLNILQITTVEICFIFLVLCWFNLGIFFIVLMCYLCSRSSFAKVAARICFRVFNNRGFIGYFRSCMCLKINKSFSLTAVTKSQCIVSNDITLILKKHFTTLEEPKTESFEKDFSTLENLKVPSCEKGVFTHSTTLSLKSSLSYK